MKRGSIIDIKRKPPKTWEEGMYRFLSWKKAQGGAERTLRGYKEIITLFFSRFPLAFSGKCRECLIEFLAQDGISPTTFNMRLKALRPFFAFCIDEGTFSSSPIEGFSKRKEQPRIVDHSPDSIRKLLNVIGTKTFSRLRDSTLLMFQLDTGIRPSEALQLSPTDIDSDTGKAVIRAVTAKTRTARGVFFSEKTASLINHLLSVRPDEWNDTVPVFCTSFGDAWNTHGWTVNLKRYAEKAGIGRFSAYDIRHCHAIQYLRNGGDVFTLQREMGHTTLSMTERYLALCDDDLKAVHSRVSPVHSLFPEKRTRLGNLKK